MRVDRNIPFCSQNRTENFMYFSKPTIADSGEYHCYAQHKNWNDQKSISINFVRKFKNLLARILTKLINFIATAHFLDFERDQHPQINSTARLKANVSKPELVKIYWLRDNRIIESSERFNFETNKTVFTIQNYSRQDDGIYEIHLHRSFNEIETRQINATGYVANVSLLSWPIVRQCANRLQIKLLVTETSKNESANVSVPLSPPFHSANEPQLVASRAFRPTPCMPLFALPIICTGQYGERAAILSERRLLLAAPYAGSGGGGSIWVPIIIFVSILLFLACLICCIVACCNKFFNNNDEASKASPPPLLPPVAIKLLADDRRPLPLPPVRINLKADDRRVRCAKVARMA